MVSKLTERRRETTRSQILATAESLFLENGLRNTSMTQISEAVGLGRGALYYYYPSKDELLRATVDMIANRFRILDDIAPTAAFPDAIRNVTSQLVKAVIGPDPDLRFLLTTLIEQLDDPPEDQVVRSIINRFRADLAKLVRRGKKAGEVRRTVNAIDASDRLTSEFLGIEIIRLMDPGFDFRAAATRVEKAFLADVAVAPKR